MVTVWLVGEQNDCQTILTSLSPTIFSRLCVIEKKAKNGDFIMAGVDIERLSLEEDQRVVEECNRFSTWTALISFITANWKENFVLFNHISNVPLEQCELMCKRPFVLPVAVLSSPKAGNSNLEAESHFVSLMQFSHCQARLTLFLGNNSGTDALKLPDLTLPGWVRPSWDAYFMQMASLAASRSNCMKRRVGAVLIRRNRVVATGYNGTARTTANCSSGGCPRCNGNVACGIGLSDCLCLHAEENALLEADTMRAHTGTLYSTTMPCLGCAKKIVQMGIQRLVYSQPYSPQHDSQAYLGMAGVVVDRFDGGEHPRFLVI